jgi:hypothetical protein
MGSHNNHDQKARGMLMVIIQEKPNYSEHYVLCVSKDCPKCQGEFEEETQAVPKKVPLPIPLKPTMSVEKYLPNIMKKYSSYNMCICSTCGYMEVFFKR